MARWFFPHEKGSVKACDRHIGTPVGSGSRCLLAANQMSERAPTAWLSPFIRSSKDGWIPALRIAASASVGPGSLGHREHSPPGQNVFAVLRLYTRAKRELMRPGRPYRGPRGRASYLLGRRAKSMSTMCDHTLPCLPFVACRRLSRSLATDFCTTGNSSPSPVASVRDAPGSVSRRSRPAAVRLTRTCRSSAGSR